MRMALRTIVAAALIVASCTDPESSHPTTPTAPFVTGVEIVGPDAVAPGQSAQFTARLRLSDDSRKLAHSVRWSTAGPAFSVDAQGVVTARTSLGEGMLTVDAIVPTGARRGTREIVVVPEGTFRLIGVVRDADVPALPILGARVEITPGSLTAVTDHNGGFRLYGVPVDSELRISTSGYVPLAQSLPFTGHGSQVFRLTPAGPQPSYDGNYTLGIDSTGCPVPSDLRSRRYDAVVTQDGLQLTVSLTEPRFQIHTNGRGNRFFGQVLGGGASFTLQPFAVSYYYYSLLSYPDVAERLSDGTYLVPAGAVVMAGSPAGLSGQVIQGSLERWDAQFPNRAVNLGGCFFPSNIQLQLSLTPR